MRNGSALVVAIALGATPLDAAPKPATVSWGKAGVAYDQYRRDSVDCGLSGATRDMSGQQAYKDSMHGIQVQNSILDGHTASGDPLLDYVLVQRRTMQRQVPALQRYLVGGVERCLIGRGYRPFALTHDQAHALGRLARGSDARFHYLHGLGSDGTVLAAQGLSVEPAPSPVPVATAPR